MSVKEVLNEREKTHGNFTEQALTAQSLKYILSVTPNWHDMPGYMREALELVCTKMARMGHGNWQEVDHPRDISGYAELIVRGLEE